MKVPYSSLYLSATSIWKLDEAHTLKLSLKCSYYWYSGVQYNIAASAANHIITLHLTQHYDLTCAPCQIDRLIDFSVVFLMHDRMTMCRLCCQMNLHCQIDE